MSILDSGTITFSTAENGKLSVELADGRTIVPAICVRLFPLSAPDEYISVLDGAAEDSPEIGVIPCLSGLAADQQELVLADLRQRRFLPEILDVRKITITNGIDEWQVLTDRGPKTFFISGRKNNIVVTEDNMLIITDVEKCRYRIPDYTALSPRAFSMVGRALP